MEGMKWLSQRHGPVSRPNAAEFQYKLTNVRRRTSRMSFDRILQACITTK